MSAAVTVVQFKRKAVQASRTLGWYVTPEQLWTMWQQQEGRCALTGRPMTLATASIDHIVPTARGGTNWLSNLRWTTKRANRAKADLLDEEFIVLCSLVIKHFGATPTEETQ